jgi:hypothetical protein
LINIAFHNTFLLEHGKPFLSQLFSIQCVGACGLKIALDMKDGNNAFPLPRTRTSLYASYFLPSTLKIWNSLLPEIKDCPSLSILKSRVDHDNVPKYYYYGWHKYYTLQGSPNQAKWAKFSPYIGWSLSLDYKVKLKSPCFFLQVTLFLQIIFVLW